MRNLIHHLRRLERMGFYEAPHHANVTPLKIPDKIEVVEVITGGEVFFEVDGHEKSFGRGTIFWHKGGQHTIYKTTPQAPYRCGVFAFSVADNNRPVSRISMWNEINELEKFVSECLDLYHSDKLDSDALCLYAYGTLLRQAMPNAAFNNREIYPAPLEKALRYIHTSLNCKISIETLANNSDISVPHMFKLFRKHLDTSPHSYILSQQLLRARTMLAGTSLPIKVIADECGFNNLEVFYRRFKNENGTSPGQYRRKHVPYHFTKDKESGEL